MSLFLSVISPILSDYRFLSIQFDTDDLKWVLLAISLLRNQDYGLRIVPVARSLGLYDACGTDTGTRR